MIPDILAIILAAFGILTESVNEFLSLVPGEAFVLFWLIIFAILFLPYYLLTGIWNLITEVLNQIPL
jgi:hypothetical protein